MEPRRLEFRLSPFDLPDLARCTSGSNSAAGVGVIYQVKDIVLHNRESAGIALTQMALIHASVLIQTIKIHKNLGNLPAALKRSRPLNLQMATFDMRSATFRVTPLKQIANNIHAQLNYQHAQKKMKPNNTFFPTKFLFSINLNNCTKIELAIIKHLAQIIPRSLHRKRRCDHTTEHFPNHNLRTTDELSHNSVQSKLQKANTI